MKKVTLFLLFNLLSIICIAQYSFEKVVLANNTNYNNELFVGDFDKNGDKDIIVCQYSSGRVVILFQVNGNFSPTIIVNGVTQPSNLQVDDFDKDGDLDFVVFYKDFNDFHIYLNKGKGEFDMKKMGLSNGFVAVESDILDVNGDGFSDIVASFSRGGLQLFLNKKDGTFSKTTVDNGVAQAGGLLIDDFDKDNKIDILSTTFSKPGSLAFYFGNGGAVPTFSLKVFDNTLNLGSGLEIADINKDGKNDVFLSEFSGNKLYYYQNNGSAFDKITIDNSISNPTELYVANLNKDSFEDIICYEQGNSSLHIYSSSDNGLSFKKFTLDNGSKLNGWIQILDWDGDSDLDIIVSGQSSIVLFKNSQINVSVQNFEKVELTVFPNPTSDFLYINTDNFISASLYNLKGDFKIKTYDEVLNISDVQSGLYNLAIQTMDSLITKLVIKK